MNKLSPLEELDPSNVGGREQLLNRMMSHQTAILNVKSVVQTQKPPQAHVDAKKDRSQKQPVKFKRLLEFGIVFATMRAVTANQKPRIDAGQPNTMKFNSLWGGKSKGAKFEERQHCLNLRAQKNRIGTAGSMKERIKNPNDPLAHPTFLFSSSSQPKTNSKLLEQVLKPQKIANPVIWNRLQSATTKDVQEAEGGVKQLQRPISAFVSTRPQPVVDRSKRPQFVKTITAEEYEKYKQYLNRNEARRKAAKQSGQPENDLFISKRDLYGNEEFDFVDEIPRIHSKSGKVSVDDLKQLKFDLIQLIIKYRIYQEEELKVIFARTTVHNIDSVSIDKLDEMYQSIKDQLDA